MITFLEITVNGLLPLGVDFPLDFSKFPLKRSVFCIANSQSTGDIYIKIKRSDNSLEGINLAENLQLYFKIFFPQFQYTVRNFVEISNTIIFPDEEAPKFLFQPTPEEDKVLLTYSTYLSY